MGLVTGSDAITKVGADWVTAPLQAGPFPGSSFQVLTGKDELLPVLALQI